MLDMIMFMLVNKMFRKSGDDSEKPSASTRMLKMPLVFLPDAHWLLQRGGKPCFTFDGRKTTRNNLQVKKVHSYY